MKKRNSKGVFVRTGEYRKCLSCDNDVYVKACHLKKKKYCSRECYRISQCGRKQSKESIAKRVAKVTGQKRTEEWKEQRSKEFHGEKNPNWKGGKSRNVRKRKHRKLAKKIKHQRGRCDLCGSKNKLELDHIIPWHVDEALRYKESNLQVLCGDCHKKKNREDGKKYWKNQYAQSIYWNNVCS